MMLDLPAMKQYFLWLGSGRTRKLDVSAKTIHLDIAARARLPVPNGGVLLDELYRLLLKEEVLLKTDDGIKAADPVWLFETVYHSVKFPRLEGLVSVQAVSAKPQFDVNFLEPTSFATSLCAQWTAVYDQPDSFRRDVLVMEMVDAQVRGTAVSRLSEACNQYSVNRELMELPKLSRWGRPSPDLPDALRRAQLLMRGVSRSLGKGNWEIEWADDGRTCWLLRAGRL